MDRLTNPPVPTSQNYFLPANVMSLHPSLMTKFKPSNMQLTPQSQRIKYQTLQSSRSNLLGMTHFKSTDYKILEEIVSSLNSSTCCLDVIPTSFLKTIFISLVKQPTLIVNTSLQSGIFPKALKTAVIKPLPKKNNLDANVLNNYRPISNLLFLGKVIEKVTT